MKNLDAFRGHLAAKGICSVEPVCDPVQIAHVNTALNPLLASRAEARRAYVHADELHELGVLDKLLGPRMQDLLFSVMPDPVLYHCHVYEIAAMDARPHIFADVLQGWHRDSDSEFVRGELTHVSVFVYLSDVGPDDGAFEFAPTDPEAWLYSGTPRIAVQGPAGYTFAWHRSFYHRASPNRGSRRRRLFKLSVQRNRFHSVHLGNEHFQKLKMAISPGDPRTDVLLGRYQGKEAPPPPALTAPGFTAIQTTGKLDISSVDLAKAQLREKARALKRALRPALIDERPPAYD